jgi:hypothetical protein
VAEAKTPTCRPGREGPRKMYLNKRRYFAENPSKT